ncbi:MAG: LysR family transcriptional regulator [Solirubrobacterales bacterium]|nr:LysR family transcriptional regulator [Solirubrobacterales bacterium]
MRTEQLEYVAAIARLGSFRSAAEALHISQPALSVTVRNLERELGVDLLDRHRSGARVSDEGRELLPHIVNVLDALDGLRRAADDRHHSARMVRIGTVNAGTVPLLTPTIRAFRDRHASTQVEVVGAQEDEIHRALREGSLDLGLLTALADDDMPPDLESTRLLTGRAVVCVRPDSALAQLEAIGIDDLLSTPLIVMRSGYLMHRLLHRLLAGRTPSVSYSTDGAEMGKLMVAEGLGATLLPDFSVIGDPLERGGQIGWRPLRDDDTEVWLVLRQPRSGSHPRAARNLHAMFVERARGLELV